MTEPRTLFEKIWDRHIVSDFSGCLNFLSRRTALTPVQPPRAPSSISVGRIASLSPKEPASSMLAAWPEADSMSNFTLPPFQRALTFATARTIAAPRLAA